MLLFKYIIGGIYWKQEFFIERIKKLNENLDS